MSNFRFLLLLLPLLLIVSCKETQVVSNDPDPEIEIWSPQVLVEKYEQGEVRRCYFQNKFIYFGMRNAPDGGAEIYDDKGRQIGVCYYNTNRVDAPCEGASECETIYRVHPNIWGKSGVKYRGK